MSSPDPNASPAPTPASQPSSPSPEPMDDTGLPPETEPTPQTETEPADDTGTPQTETEPVPPQPSPVVIEGCSVIGAYDRVFIFQRAPATGICTEFGLVTPIDEDDPTVFALTDLSLPMRWTVEEMSSFECDSEGNTVSGATPTHFMRADGTVAFADLQSGLPSRVKLDVLLSVPSEDAGTAAAQVIAEQRLVADDIDLLAGCSLRN